MDIYKHQSANKIKTWLLMSVFLVFIILIGFIFAQVYGNSFILYFAVGVSLIMNFAGYWYSDKIALKMTGAKEATRGEYFDLYNAVENLSITAGLPTPKVYVIVDPAPNAFATGRNKEHSAVAVTTGLLQMLDKTELEGVIAHELSHIGNRDILLSTTTVVLAGFVAILSDMFLRISFWGGHNRDSNKGGGVMIVIGIAAAILAPIAASLIRMAISRKREFLADATGVLLTRYPEGLASALEKISKYSGGMKKANNATAHLFISNPFGKKGTAGLNKLFMTHPPASDRIKALRGM